MSEGAGGGIFMDIMARLDGGALNTVMSNLTSKMSSLGKTTGASFGKDFGAEAGTASQKLAAQLEQNMQTAQRAVEKAMDGMVASQNNVVLSAGKLDAAQLKLTETVAKYGDASAKAADATVGLTRATQGQEAAATAAARATEAQVTAALNLEAATRRQAEAQDASAFSAAGASTALNTAGLAITAGFTVAIGESIKKAGEFQTTQVRLVTSAGETASNLKMVSDGLLQMAGQVGYSAQELSTGMYTIESAGYHGAEGLNVMKAAAQGAKMEGADLKTVADAVSTALTDYHLPASDAATVTSQLVTAVGQGKTNMEEFSSSLHSITPLASAAGISLADVTGALAEMTSHGQTADVASQNLADTLRHMMSATGPMRDELAQINMTSTDLNDSLSTRGLSGTLEMLSQKILATEGPDGKMLLNAFNSSKDAAANLNEVVAKMPTALQQVTQQFEAGAISSTDYRKAVGSLPGNMKDLASGFLSAWDKANGFTTAIKNGSPEAQNYVQSIKAITGDATGLNTTLMLTGENADAVTNNIKLISAATKDAGGNVKGWDEIQNTFNQKMSEFKASIGATAISIGTDFLPAATNIAKALADVGTWLSNNKGFLDALVIAVGAAAGAFVVFKTASAMWTVMSLGIDAASFAMGLFTASEAEATVGATGLATALAATGISEIVLGVTALVAAIAGLVVGVKYAYDNWGWFHTAVQDTWNVLKGIGEWIAGVAVGAWHILQAAIGPVETAFKDIGAAAMWLWHNAIEPAMNGISTVLRVAAAIILTVLAVPFVIAFKLIEAAVKFLYSEVIKPTFDQIGTVFHWLYDNVVQPVVGFIKDEITGMGIVFNWLHDNVIQPVFNAIADVWNWLYDTIIHPIIEGIKKDIDGWGVIFHWLHDTVIKPVGDAIGLVMSGMKIVFKDVVDWLETQWGRIVGIVGPPIKFIVDTVYNDAIVPTWNDIAGVFGLGKLDKVNASSFGGSGGDGGGTSSDGSIPVSALAATHAGGGVWQGAGVLPGYAPGVDVHNAILSPGEGVAVPELVNAIGPQRFMALNAAYSGGRQPGSGPAFAGGGIFDVIGDVIDAGKFTAKLATDPEGAVKDAFSGVTNKIGSTPGDPSQWLDAAKAIPTKFMDAVISKAKSWLTSGGNEAWVSGAGAEQWAPLIIKALALEGFPTSQDYVSASEAQIMTESGGNPNIIQSAAVHDVNSGGNEGRGLVQVTPGTASGLGLADLGGNIFDPLTNLRLGLRELKSQHGGDLLGEWGHGHGYGGGGIFQYAGGGIATAKTTDRSAIDRALNWARSLEGHAYNDQGWLDCSGMVSGLFDSLKNINPARAFTTMSDFLALGFKKGSGGIFDIGVNPKPGAAGHMAATLDGHNIESGGSHNNIAVDGAAAGANDAQFTDHYYLPGSVFSPAWTGTGATPGATSKTNDKLSADQTKWTKAVAKAQENEQKANEAATKHDESVTKYNDEATKADALAAKSSGDAKTKHVAAAAHYRDLAQKAKDAADKDRANAEKYKQAAVDDQAKADAAKSDATTTTNADGTKTTTSTTDSGPVKAMSLHDFMSKLGGIGADAITETLGVSDTVFADPTKSVFVKIGNALAGAKWGQYSTTDSTKTGTDTTGTTADTVPATTTDTTTSADDSSQEDTDGNYTSADVTDTGGADTQEAQVYDDGGWLQPGKLAINLGRKPEPVLAPRDSDHLQALAKGGGNSSSPKAYVIIENQHVNGGDGRAVGRDIYREMLAYQGAGSR